MKSEYVYKWSIVYPINVHKALSFEMAVMPWPSGLSVVIKLIIKDLKSDMGTVGVLHS